MANGKRKRTRKRFNRFVKSLSELYDRSYHEVENIYYNQNCDIEGTKMILAVTA